MSSPNQERIENDSAEVIRLFGLTETECGIALAAGHRLVDQGRAVRVDAYQDRIGARYVSLVGGGGHHYTVLRDRGKCRLLGSGYAYFANSFRLVGEPAGWAVARADHGGPFVAGLERGDVLACQFHPELSGDYGAALLRRWLNGRSESC